MEISGRAPILNGRTDVPIPLDTYTSPQEVQYQPATNLPLPEGVKMALLPSAHCPP